MLLALVLLHYLWLLWYQRAGAPGPWALAEHHLELPVRGYLHQCIDAQTVEVRAGQQWVPVQGALAKPGDILDGKVLGEGMAMCAVSCDAVEGVVWNLTQQQLVSPGVYRTVPLDGEVRLTATLHRASGCGDSPRGLILEGDVQRLMRPSR